MLEITNNIGGSGSFSSIARLEKTAADQFVEWWRINGGDRGNDGGLPLIEFSGHEVIYAIRATPFRLLNPVDKTNWRFVSMAQSQGKPPRRSFRTAIWLAALHGRGELSHQLCG